MKRLALAGMLLALLIAVPHTAGAVAIEFVEGSKTVAIGDPFTLQLRIFDTGALLVPPLHSFDIEVGFSQSSIAFEGAQFAGPGLDDQLNFSGLADQSITPPFSSGFDRSSVRVAETSNDLVVPLQPGQFVLATLTFHALASGTTQIAVLEAILDGFNGGFPVVSLGASTITAVPEPEHVFWLLAGLVLVAIRAIAVRRETH
jgi:hypothetical protein